MERDVQLTATTEATLGGTVHKRQEGSEGEGVMKYWLRIINPSGNSTLKGS
jgi:hypothetical protein